MVFIIFQKWEHHKIMLKSLLQTNYLNLAPCIQSTLQLSQEKFHQTLIPTVIHHFQTKAGHCLKESLFVSIKYKRIFCSIYLLMERELEKSRAQRKSTLLLRQKLTTDQYCSIKQIRSLFSQWSCNSNQQLWTS